MRHTAVPIFFTASIAIIGLFLTFSCTKPTPFGADLLSDQTAEFIYTDTLTLQCSLVREDSIVTSDLSSTADYLLCGQLNDPIFGASRSDIYTQIRLLSLDPAFQGAALDSVVLYLRYDAPGFYGDTTQPQTLRVYRVGADTFLRWDQQYYSNQTLPTGNQIGELSNFLPKPNTASSLFDTTTQAPYIRIPLDNAFGQELLDMDSVSLTSDTLFWRAFRGIRLTTESAGLPGTMMAFDLNNSSFSRIRLYYKKDTTATSYDYFFLGSNKFTHFSHDYTGSTVAPYLNQATDDLMFVQGMTGLRLKVEIPFANQLGSIAVNKAELDLTAASLPNDHPALETAKQLVFTELLGDTLVSLSSDVLYSLGPTLNSGFNLFGGYPETETDQGITLQRYRLTLTQRFQDMVDDRSGDLKKRTIFVNVYPQSRSAMRAILYGPKNSVFPARLALKYTKVQ